MKNIAVNLGVLLSVFSSIGYGKDAIAQSITAAEDGTMTIVNQDGDTFTIDGGTLSSDGRNLFHSLKEFGLSPEQIANFLSNPNIQNILTRVTGGNASTIEGLIQVTGGDSNLFIMNPAGVIFGEGASLNVPADFTVTTATGIGFGDGIFNAFGNNDYSSLVGNPSSFNFSDANGTIVNAGDLSVLPGQNLSLLAGTVVNTGSLDAPEGEITIATVPGGSTIRVSQAGSPLSLEIEVPLDSEGEALPITVLDLPGLLTGSEIDTGLVVDDAGGVKLDGTPIPTAAGTTIIGGDVTAKGGEIEVRSTIIGVLSSTLDVSGTSGGGRITIGDELVGNYQADVVYIDAESQINADAGIDGDGGTISIIGDRTTRVYGELSATGGESGGDGGTVTTSSNGFLALSTSPDVSASVGDGGSWLMKLPEVEIVSEEELSLSTAEAFTLVDAKTQIRADLIETALGGETDITISTVSSSLQPQDNDITLSTTLDYDGTLSNSLSLEAAGNVVITPDGAVVDTDAVNTPADSLNVAIQSDTDQNGTGVIYLNGDVFTGGGNFSAVGNNLDVVGTVDSGGGDLTIISDKIDLTAASLNGTGNLLIRPQTADLDLTIGGEEAAFLNAAELDAFGDGFNSITIGAAEGSGMITVGDSSFQDPVTIQSPSGTIEVDGAIVGSDNGAIELNSTTVNLNDDLVTAGNPITIEGDVVLGDNVVLDTTSAEQSGALVDLNGTVDGSFDLTVNVGEGNFEIDQNVGEVTALNSLTVDGSGITIVNGSSVTTRENQSYNSNIILGSDTAFSSIDGSFSQSSEQNIVTDGFDLNISAGEIITGSIFTAGSLDSGAVNLTATDGKIETANINASGTDGNAGTISLTATGNIITNDLDASSTEFDSGEIEINSGGAIAGGNLDTSNSTNAGGGVTVTADTNLTVANIDTSSAQINADGGKINLSGSEIVADDLTTNKNSINLNAAEGEIKTGKISNRGGDVAIATSDNIQVDSINTSNPDGSGGDVDIDTDGSFVAIDTIDDTNASINTTGSESGSVSIRHGGNGETDFTVNYGQQSNSDNGTAGTIVTGNTEIESGKFKYSYTQKDVEIISIDAPVETEIDTESIDPITPEENPTPEVDDEIEDQADNLDDEIEDQADNLDDGIEDQADNLDDEIEDQADNLDDEIEDQADNLDDEIEDQADNLDDEIEDQADNLDDEIEDQADNAVDEPETNDNSATTEPEEKNSSSQESSMPPDSMDTGLLTIEPDTSNISEPTEVESNQASAEDQVDDSNSRNNDLRSPKLDSILEIDENNSNQPSTVEESSFQGENLTTSEESSNQTEANVNQTNSTSDQFKSETLSESSTQLNSTEAENSQSNVENKPEENSTNSGNSSLDQEETAVEAENAIEENPISTPINTAFIATPTQPKTLFQTRETLQAIEQNTAIKPALIYVGFSPTEMSGSKTFAELEAALTAQFNQYLSEVDESTDAGVSIPSAPTDKLELFIVTNEGKAISVRVDVTRQEVLQTAAKFYQQVSELGDDYLEPAKQLYQWLVAPIEDELEAQGIKNLIYVMPDGLRLVPLAALYDQNTNQYLAQKYNSGLAPSFSLVDSGYRNLQDAPVLAMGASTFEEDEYQNDLPAVGIEVPLIAQQIREGKYYLNEEFTRQNLVRARNRNPYPIIHLATHADFNSGDVQNSYIQLYDSKLKLDDLRMLQLNDPAVDLLVISACRSAFGDPNAELGFAGLAAQIGVKSVIASLWYVGDTGTLALMSEFYRDLETATIKAEALRTAQIAMITGEVQRKGNQIVGQSDRTYSIDLPASVTMNQEDLSHPFYWAAFTLIGSPW